MALALSAGRRRPRIPRTELKPPPGLAEGAGPRGSSARRASGGLGEPGGSPSSYLALPGGGDPVAVRGRNLSVRGNAIPRHRLVGGDAAVVGGGHRAPAPEETTS